MSSEDKRSRIIKSLKVGDEVIIVVPDLAQDHKVEDIIQAISPSGITQCGRYTFYPDGRAIDFDSPRPYILGKKPINKNITTDISGFHLKIT